jgi:Domain of unknown function (DUF4157)/A nuclease family of the HNH/ENDO VII superfamily with conserved AHH
MGVTALTPTPARPPPTKTPTVAKPAAQLATPKRTLGPPTCDCGAPAGLSGHCPSCDRVSLQPRRAAVPEPPKKAGVASVRLLAKPPPPGLQADSLGPRSAAPPVAVLQTLPVRVQTQMRVSSPTDAAEQEATAVGRQVMRMPNPDEAAPPSVSQGSAGVAQRLASPGGERHVDPSILSMLGAGSSSGSPLPRDIQSFMEPRFKADFSGVRIHTDQHAARLAAHLGARAFTVGRDIYFAAGEFQLNKPEGWELVAHELTHTLQQGGASHVPVAPPKAPPSVGAGGDLDSAATHAVATNDADQRLGPQALQTLESRIRLMALEGSSVVRQAVAPTTAARPKEERRSVAPTVAPRRPVAPGAARPTVGDEAAIPAAPAGEQSVSAPTGAASGAMASSVVAPTASGAAGTAIVPTTSVGEGPVAPPAGVGYEKSAAPGATASGDARDTKNAKPAGASGEGAAVERKTPDVRDPRQAIAPTIGAVKKRAGGARAHPAAAAPVSAAEAAGTDPSRAAARAADQQTVANVGAATQKSDEVTPTFKTKLKQTLAQAIDRDMKSPKTKDEADTVMKEGAQRASDSLGAQLTTSREAAAGPVQQAVDHPVEAPAAGSAPALMTEQAGPPPAPVPATSAVPAPLPAERLDMSSDRAPSEQLMAKNDIDQKQLEDGNDPAFGPTLSARAEAEKHEGGVEASYRASESAERGDAHTVAQAALATGLASIHTTRGAQFSKVGDQQVATKDQNLAAKNAVTEKIANIKKQTLQNVNETLAGLEERATQMFEEGLHRAEGLYEDAFSEAKGGFGTWLTTWGDDWDKHIEDSLRTAKAAYRAEVDRTIDQVADFVEERLTTAKRHVSEGLHQVETYVSGLDGSVKEYAQAALKEVSGDFEQMAGDIDSRADKLIDKLTEQYRASYQRMEAKEEKLREENKSLWRRVYDATVGLIEKILAFKDMLLGILGRAASVIGDIIKHPIRFLGNLIDAVKTGISNFVSNIAKHLKEGLLEWLFGAVAQAGIQLPKSFDLKGIMSLVLQVLGITYANFRARAVALLGEKVVGAIEKVAEVFLKIVTEGPGALWEWIKEKLGDLKAMVMDQVQDFVVTRVIVAGVTWLIGLLNPASAFFKACKAIYDIIMFFVERGSQIIALVNAVIDSMAAIASGAIGGAAAMVENALARAIPVVIGFLASLLGIGGIGEKIKSVIETLRKPINAAIDWVIGKALQLVKAAGKFVGGLFGGGDKDKKEEKPKEEDPERAAKVEAGKAALHQQEKAYLKDGHITRSDAERVAANVHREHPIFKSIQVVDGGKTWNYSYVASPAETETGEPKDLGEVKVAVDDTIVLIGKEEGRDKVWPAKVTAVNPGNSVSYLGPGGKRHSYNKGTLSFASFKKSWRLVESDADLQIQKHHKVPWTNQDHWNHPLRVLSGVDLQNDPDNLMPLGGHAGRHSPTYHASIKGMMNQAYTNLSSKDQATAHEAMSKVMSEIERDIANGSLKPYDDKEVWIP